ncbi:MAG: hypothetical protein IPP29_20245 [Bacteroidetes bacterium]|nr:hypothetical protein [Bacteroidota bacterium]
MGLFYYDQTETNAQKILLINNQVFLSGSTIDGFNANFFTSFVCNLDTAGNLLWYKRYLSNKFSMGGRIYKFKNNLILNTGYYKAIIDTLGNIISNCNQIPNNFGIGFDKDWNMYFGSGNNLSLVNVIATSISVLASLIVFHLKLYLIFYDTTPVLRKFLILIH